MTVIERVGRELLEHELRKRRVAVEGADDVITIGPGIGPRQVGFVAFAFAEADDVEPVAAPALAVIGRSQESFDECFVCPWIGVGDELVDGIGRGRQAGQVEGEAADEGGAGASGAGWRPAEESFARMNASIGFLAQVAIVKAFLVDGTAALRIGWSDHQSGPARGSASGSLGY